jgi:hypothetical protein
MDDEKKFSGTLDGVSYQVRPRDHRIHIEYRGFAADLLAIGAIEPAMAEKPKNRYVAQYDSNGDRYLRRTMRSGKLTVSRMITTRERARRLPGVPADISTPLIDWLDAHPGEIHTEKRPCCSIDGTETVTHAWMNWSGRREVLDAAGILGRVHLNGKILDGYYQYTDCVRLDQPMSAEREEYERVRKLWDQLDPYSKAVAAPLIRGIIDRVKKKRLRQTRPSYLRLVVNNEEVSHVEQ